MARLIRKRWIVGDIRMWGGDETKIPSEWVVCDGNNGTPNLTGRVPVGADVKSKARGEVPQQGALFGSTKVTPTILVNNATLSAAQMPWHQHSQPYGGSGQAGADNGGAPTGAPTGYGTSRREPPVNPSGSSASHAHGARSSEIDLRQKSVGILYIMKIK